MALDEDMRLPFQSVPSKLQGGRRPYRATNSRELTKRYQQSLAAELRRLFPNQVEREWRAIPHDELVNPGDISQQIMYAPVVDVAVGPFATQGRYVDEYDALMDQHSDFIERLIEHHKGNVAAAQSALYGVGVEGLRRANTNSRCLLAIEIERGNADQKYLMGSIVNAVALGRVGVLVCWNQRRLREVLRLSEYIRNLQRYGKNVFNPENLLIVSRFQMIKAIRPELSPYLHKTKL